MNWRWNVVEQECAGFSIAHCPTIPSPSLNGRGRSSLVCVADSKAELPNFPPRSHQINKSCVGGAAGPADLRLTQADAADIAEARCLETFRRISKGSSEPILLTIALGLFAQIEIIVLMLSFIQPLRRLFSTWMETLRSPVFPFLLPQRSLELGW